MAELKRYGVNRTTSTVKPVGIVAMTGLRSAARSLEQVAQTADQFTDFFHEKAAFAAREQAEKDISTTPMEKYQEAFLDKDNEYVADANGNPVNAEFVSQIPRKDQGLFNNEYNQTWNKIAAQRNANDTVLTAWGQLDAWHADRLDDLDFGVFEATGQTYLSSTLDKLDPRIRSAVALKLQPRLQTLYNDLRTKKFSRDRALNQKAREATINSLSSQLEEGIISHAIDDPGLQQTYLNLADAIYSGVAVGDYPSEAAVNKLNDAGSRLARGQLIGQINDMLPDGISPEEDLKMSEITNAIGIGNLMVKTLQFDPETKAISIEEVAISSLIPDVKERRELSFQIGDLATRQRENTINHQQLEAAAWQSHMHDLQNNAIIATRNGDTEAYNRAVEGIAELENSISDSNNEAKAEWMQKALTTRAAILDRGDLAQSEREYLASIADMENMLSPEQIGAVPGYYLDEEDRKAFVSGQSLTNRIDRLKGQHKVLSDYIKEISKPAEGQEEFIEYIKKQTGTVDPSKNVRNVADVFLRKYYGVDEINWNEEGYRASISMAAPALKAGIIPPSLGAELTNAIRSGDPERIQNAYKIYEYMDNMREYLTMDNVKKQIGNEAFRTYEYMRKAIELSGTFPTDVTFLERVQKVFNGETRLRWSDLDREARDAATTYINEQLDPWFAFDLPNFPNEMRNEIHSIIPETYEESEGDSQSAGRQAAELAYGRITKKRWGHDDPFMFGEGWVKYPAAKNYPNLSDLAIKNFVRGQMIDRGVSGEFVFAPNEVASENIKTKLMFHRMGVDGQPVYKLVRKNAELSALDQRVYTDMIDKDGHIIEIDLRPLSHEVSSIMKSISEIDRAIETQSNIYWRNPTPESRANIEALSVIRNKMAHYPETSVPVGEIDIDWHDESLLGGKPNVRRSSTECPPGYRMGPKGCYRVEGGGVHRSEMGERIE